MLIQKSFRLPEELVAFIDSQEGKNLSDKLINLISIYRGIQEAVGNIEIFQADITDYARLLEGISQDMSRTIVTYSSDESLPFAPDDNDVGSA